jgi:triosephosphate isomerase
VARVFVNLKRFEVPRAQGGICPGGDPGAWIEHVMEQTAGHGLGSLAELELVYLLPEGLILPARRKLRELPAEDVLALRIGCQGVYRDDVRPGGNFGAFTTLLPAAAAHNLGCTWAIIGHSEERRDKLGVIEVYDPGWSTRPEDLRRGSEAVNRLIGREVDCALQAALNVLLCVGETAEERGEGSFAEQRPRIESVLSAQLESGLEPLRDAAKRALVHPPLQVVIGYEPVWAIGPGKTPPAAQYIGFVAAFIKETVRQRFGFVPEVVYGGGLREENAAMLAEIEPIDGGLVALTRFTPPVAFEPEGLKRIIERYLDVRQGKKA